MDRTAQLRFAAMPAQVQREAIRRLALKGLEASEISRVTGWSTLMVSELLAPVSEVSYMPRSSPQPAPAARPAIA